MKNLRIFYYFLKLIRWPNLVIVVITMYLMRMAIIAPMLHKLDPLLQLQLNHFDFFLLVLATTLITAGGYIINDYFDHKTDMINRPYRVIVGRFIKRRIAMTLHIVFNIVGILAGFYISYKNGIHNMSTIFILASGALWFYSTTYKKQVLIGNVMVSLLSAMVPLMVILFEFPLLHKAYHLNFNALFYWVASFAFFAFILNLVREIVKDIEDLEGDEAYGRMSLPMVLSLKKTKIMVVSLLFILVAGLSFVLIYFLGNLISLLYLGILIILPALTLIVLTIKANKRKDYALISLIIKIIMVAGVCYALLVWFLLTKNY